MIAASRPNALQTLQTRLNMQIMHAFISHQAFLCVLLVRTRLNMQIMRAFISYQAFLCVLLEEKDPILQSANQVALSKICCKARH